MCQTKHISHHVIYPSYAWKILNYTLIMALRARRGARVTTSRSEGSPTVTNTSREDDEFTGDVRRRCIPVDCIPLCPTCQEHNYPFANVKKCLKCFVAILLIAVLASYLGNCMQSEDNENNRDTGATTTGIPGESYGTSPKVQGTLDQRMNALEIQFNTLLNEVRVIKESMDHQRDRLTDCMKEETKGLINEKLNLYDSDKTGLPDFALENLGGCILSVRNTKTYKEGAAQISILGVPIMSFATDPRAIIQATTVPGECWAFAGDKGTVVIQLISPVLITHVSLEHISAKLSPTGDISSAPKEFVLKGLACLDDSMPHTYGTFIYSCSGPTLQTFTVQNPTPKPYKIVEFSVLSNQGNKDFTCIYRVRVHGKPAADEVKRNSI